MCTYLTKHLEMDGSGKGAAGWIRVTAASVYFDHPAHAPADHTLTVDPVAGIVCLAKTGAEVDRGQPLLELWGRPGQDPQPALLALEHAIRVGNSPPPPRALVLEHVAGS